MSLELVDADACATALAAGGGELALEGLKDQGVAQVLVQDPGGGLKRLLLKAS